jgi:hypothetical protein
MLLARDPLGHPRLSDRIAVLLRAEVAPLAPAVTRGMAGRVGAVTGC